MFFDRVIKISKFQKTRFSSYFEGSRKSNSCRVPYSYKAFGKNSVHENLFIGFASMGWQIFIKKKVHFREVEGFKMRPDEVFSVPRKTRIPWKLKLCTLASLVCDETFSVQVPNHKVYTHQITSHSNTVLKKYTKITQSAIFAVFHSIENHWKCVNFWIKICFSIQCYDRSLCYQHHI